MTSKRPVYAIVLFALATVWICLLFLPLLGSVLFPNTDLRQVIYALEGRGIPPEEATTQVEETLAGLGPLTKAVPVAYSSGITIRVDERASQRFRKVQTCYVGWFQKRRGPLVFTVTRYENGYDQTVYEFDRVNGFALVRGYTLPIFVFGVSLFLIRRRAPSKVSTTLPPSRW